MEWNERRLSNVEWIPMGRINITPARSFSLCLDYYYQKGKKKENLWAIRHSKFPDSNDKEIG